jgi:hypothetical protein
MKILYLLPFTDGEHFKIGTTIDLCQRFQKLICDFSIDLNASYIIKAKSSKFIAALERILLAEFPFNTPEKFNKMEGHSEIRPIGILEIVLNEIKRKQQARPELELEIKLGIEAELVKRKTIKKGVHSPGEKNSRIPQQIEYTKEYLEDTTEYLEYVKEHCANMHSFETEDAITYGVKEAVLIQYIREWTQQNKKINPLEERTWTNISVSGLCELFPYLTHKKISSALENLVRKGVLLKSRKPGYDRTNMYCFVEEDKFIESVASNKQILDDFRSWEP